MRLHAGCGWATTADRYSFFRIHLVGRWMQGRETVYPSCAPHPPTLQRIVSPPVKLLMICGDYWLVQLLGDKHVAFLTTILLNKNIDIYGDGNLWLEQAWCGDKWLTVIYKRSRNLTWNS
jgi:hypothetical protein